MKNILVPIVLLVVFIVIIVLNSWMYVVEEGKQVVITQFGRPVAEVKEGTRGVDSRVRPFERRDATRFPE